MRKQIVRRPPPTMLLAVAGTVRDVMTRGRTMTPAPVTTATAVIGGLLCLLVESASNFLRHRATVDPVRVEQARRLVAGGPNQPTCNPIYLGLTDLLLPHAVVCRSPSALIPPADFVWLIGRHQISAEEKTLEERSGQDYLDYKETAPRWLNVPGSSPGDRSRGPRVRC